MIQIKGMTILYPERHPDKNDSDYYALFFEDPDRIKVELVLAGRAKYMDEKFLRERLDRVLHLITEDYKISDTYKRGPKGLTITIEKK